MGLAPFALAASIADGAFAEHVAVLAFALATWLVAAAAAAYPWQGSWESLTRSESPFDAASRAGCHRGLHPHFQNCAVIAFVRGMSRHGFHSPIAAAAAAADHLDPSWKRWVASCWAA